MLLERLARDAVWFAGATFFKRLSRESRETGSEDLDRAERVLKRLEWQRRAGRALQLAL